MQLIMSIALATGFFGFCIPAAEASESDAAEAMAVNAETSQAKKLSDPQYESLIPSAGRDLSTTHFTWGAELGSSIDLGGNDMSSFDCSVVMGYKNSAIRLAGLSVGLRRSFGSRNTFIPLMAVLRTSFRSKPSLFFMHLEAGYSFNSIANSHVRGDYGGSLGLGINLSRSSKFMTHIIIAYGFQHFDVKHREEAGLKTENVPLAQLSFGINF